MTRLVEDSSLLSLCCIQICRETLDSYNVIAWTLLASFQVIRRSIYHPLVTMKMHLSSFFVWFSYQLKKLFDPKDYSSMMMVFLFKSFSYLWELFSAK